MKSERERLQELDNEPFYLKLFSGTRMPIAPNFTEVIMFNDMFSIQTEEGKVENIDDIGTIELVKALLLDNIKNFEIMEKSVGEPMRNSYNHNVSFKIDDNTFSINRNVLKEDARNIYNVFEYEFMKIINVDKYI